MLPQDKFLHIHGMKQPIFYYRFPPSRSGPVYINMPRLVYEIVSDWIESKAHKRVILEDCGSWFTLYDAVVNVDNVTFNRYGSPSHDLTVSCANIVRGIFKEQK